MVRSRDWTGDLSAEIRVAGMLVEKTDR